MVDYSKWDNIEVSDDEDDTHPNIDTPSLFKWRHEARVERMNQAKKEKDTVLTAKELTRDKLEETRKHLETLKTEGADEAQVQKTAEELKNLEDERKKWQEKEEELSKKERLTPWNVDTLSKDGFQKTLINRYEERDEDLSEEQLEEKQKKFVEKNEKDIKKFGMYRRLEDTQKFLIDHPHLACEQTANYLVIWCIDLEEEGKTSLMEQVSHQTITMQFLLELAKNLKEDPRACIRPFFTKMRAAEAQYMEAFNDELKAFIGRVKERAEIRHQRRRELEEEQRKAEEEERQARLGPGGLDPQEVFESLPEALQKCFESQDIPLLQKTISEMDLEEAQYHMKRCVDSGLWVPEGGKTAEEGDKSQPGDDEEEEVYEDVKESFDEEGS